MERSIDPHPSSQPRAMEKEAFLRSNVSGGSGTRGKGKEKIGPGNCLNMECKEKWGT